jgi:hypothetical protein
MDISLSQGGLRCPQTLLPATLDGARIVDNRVPGEFFVEKAYS